VSLRIEVDRDRCIGSGNCSFYAPATFDLDDELKVMVLSGAETGEADAEGDVRAAAEGCPVKAILIGNGDVPDQRVEGDVADQVARRGQGDVPDQRVEGDVADQVARRGQGDEPDQRAE
jgi:ferredoxin